MLYVTVKNIVKVLNAQFVATMKTDTAPRLVRAKIRSNYLHRCSAHMSKNIYQLIVVYNTLRAPINKLALRIYVSCDIHLNTLKFFNSSVTISVSKVKCASLPSAHVYAAISTCSTCLQFRSVWPYLPLLHQDAFNQTTLRNSIRIY